ncbi:hypothetical protein [Polymorphobacter arshaanensis]|uniref:hypothetical protein n=1 Tax=Glacieibacterium arshaanense TaxID=2511025 RepID=UPI001A9CA986|nr:hypothetical protein [Polymorphobacter arshaanensis]
MKRDIKHLISAADKALTRLTNPLHRKIAANYRLHAMLEVSGRWEEIFAPDMTVDHPFYRVASPQGLIELDGREQVQSFYKGLVETDTTVMILDHEELVIDDWGFASEALYNTYLTGEQAMARGAAGAQLGKKYIEQRWVCMIWPYDAKGRMIGERVYPAPTVELVECPDEDFLTVEDAHREFGPLIRQAQDELRDSSG